MMPTRKGRLVCWLEVYDGDGRTAVVEQTEVLAAEAGDEAALLVGHGEDEIDFVDLDLDGGDGFFLRGAGWRAGGRLLGCSRWEPGGVAAVAGVTGALGLPLRRDARLAVASGPSQRQLREQST